MRTVKVTVTAADRKAGMTVAELDGFLREAVGSGVDPATVVEATVGFRGQLQRVSIDGVTDSRARTVDLGGGPS